MTLDNHRAHLRYILRAVSDATAEANLALLDAANASWRGLTLHNNISKEGSR